MKYYLAICLLSQFWFAQIRQKFRPAEIFEKKFKFSTFFVKNRVCISTELILRSWNFQYITHCYCSRSLQKIRFGKNFSRLLENFENVMLYLNFGPSRRAVQETRSSTGSQNCLNGLIELNLYRKTSHVSEKTKV